MKVKYAVNNAQKYVAGMSPTKLSDDEVYETTAGLEQNKRKLSKKHKGGFGAILPPLSLSDMESK